MSNEFTPAPFENKAEYAAAAGVDVEGVVEEDYESTLAEDYVSFINQSREEGDKITGDKLIHNPAVAEVAADRSKDYINQVAMQRELGVRALEIANLMFSKEDIIKATEDKLQGVASLQKDANERLNALPKDENGEHLKDEKGNFVYAAEINAIAREVGDSDLDYRAAKALANQAEYGSLSKEQANDPYLESEAIIDRTTDNFNHRAEEAALGADAESNRVVNRVKKIDSLTEGVRKAGRR